MPHLDSNTMDWLTGVFAPLLAAMVSALVGAGGALYGVRWEAKRADRKAAAEALRLTRTEAVEATHRGLIDWLYRSANVLLPEGMSKLQPTGRTFDATLVGDPATLLDIVGFTTDLARRCSGSGATPEDLTKLATLDVHLAVVVQMQLDRIQAGHEPARFEPTAEMADALRAASDSLV